MLSAALLELMLEQRYDAITVQHIIDRANVGRSTFYAHYLDKEDLLISEFTRVLDALSRHIEQRGLENQGTPPGVGLFFQHVQMHQQLYNALVRGGPIDLLYKKGHQRLRHNIERHLVALTPPDRASAALLSLVADSLAGTILTMLRWWLDHGMPYTPEQMDGLFHQLALPGVYATLGIPRGTL